MTKDLLYTIIIELNKIDFHVVAITSDMGATNVGLWRSLDVSVENTSFEHPIKKTKIYVFADVPHLLKLARNHLLDK